MNLSMCNTNRLKREESYLARGGNSLPEAEVADEIDGEQTKGHVPLDGA